MSFLFDKKTKKAINIVWGVVAVVVAIGMILAFGGGLTSWIFS